MTTKTVPQKKVSGMFPVTLVKKVEGAAKKNDRSVAAEMRVRLERSFSTESTRATTGAAT